MQKLDHHQLRAVVGGAKGVVKTITPGGVTNARVGKESKELFQVINSRGPETALLAHELAHVVQQRTGR